MKKSGRFGFCHVKVWQLVVVLIPLVFVDATLMRMEHVKMTELRNEVLVADEAGESDEVIGEKIVALKEYVFSHNVINIVSENGLDRVTFGTGPFYLEHTYIRAANKALSEAEEKLKGDTNPNGNIYSAASEVCQPQAIANGWSWDDANYINCMVGEIQKYPAADDIQDVIKASLPSTELFRHNYASPVWAPTLVGFLLLITFIVIVVILIKFIKWIIIWLSLLFA